jgi:hypothetical protein
VSWHAAQAYCQSEQARLPRWYEWEFAAAADEQHADARQDPIWLARILGWYSRPANLPPQAIGLEPANFYAIQDLHGLTWEFCGGAALSLGDKTNYAILIRLALLAAMEANQGGNYLGFRGVREEPASLSLSGVKP